MFHIVYNYGKNIFYVSNANRNSAKNLLQKGKQKEMVACRFTNHTEERKESSHCLFCSVSPAMHMYYQLRKTSESACSEWLQQLWQIKTFKKKKHTKSGSAVVPVDEGRKGRGFP